MDEIKIKEFKHRLTIVDRYTLRWFYDNHIKPVSSLTYSGFTLQLNGYAPVSEPVIDQINQYMQTA